MRCSECSGEIKRAEGVKYVCRQCGHVTFVHDKLEENRPVGFWKRLFSGRPSGARMEKIKDSQSARVVDFAQSLAGGWPRELSRDEWKSINLD